jgi:hypothetical protein
MRNWALPCSAALVTLPARSVKVQSHQVYLVRGAVFAAIGAADDPCRAFIVGRKTDPLDRAKQSSQSPL